MLMATGATRGGVDFLVIALLSLAAVGAALVSQHVFDMQPCPWCVLQRVIFLGIAVACGIGLLWRGATGRAFSAGLAFVLALLGIAAALWQHFQAAASTSCNLTLADKIVSRWMHLDSMAPDVFEARASCADAAVNLLGVPYDFWSLGLFAVLTVALVRILQDWRR